ncbi:MAG: zinc ribbon domain-containing protein [Planctomycetes bacterium]|nr:zinc ribbon domain-containing protein [Planctomycetota bacterium]
MKRTLAAPAFLAALFLVSPALAGDLPEWAKAIEEKLDTVPFTFQGEDVPFEDIVQVFRESGEFNIVLDPRALEAFGEQGLKVSLNVRELKLGNALKLLTTLHGFSTKLSCGALVLSTAPLLDSFPTDPPGAPEGASEDDRALYAKLAAQRVGRVEFEAHPLLEVLEFLRDNFDLNLMADPELTRREDKLLISLRLNDVTVGQTLHLIAAILDLEVRIENAVIVVAAAPDAGARPDQCPFCGAQREAEFKFCPQCGKNIERFK